MIDASIVQTPKQSINKEEKAIVNKGAMPVARKPAKRRQKDIDARWTKKHSNGKAATRSHNSHTTFLKSRNH